MISVVASEIVDYFSKIRNLIETGNILTPKKYLKYVIQKDKKQAFNNLVFMFEKLQKKCEYLVTV